MNWWFNNVLLIEVIISLDYRKLALLDIHLEWCGPCEAIKPQLRTLYFEIDEADKRIDFFTVESSLITDHSFKDKIGKVTCRPKFAVISEGEIKGVVDGADYTKISELVDKYIGNLEEE